MAALKDWILANGVGVILFPDYIRRDDIVALLIDQGGITLSSDYSNEESIVMIRDLSWRIRNNEDLSDVRERKSKLLLVASIADFEEEDVSILISVLFKVTDVIDLRQYIQRLINVCAIINSPIYYSESKLLEAARIPNLQIFLKTSSMSQEQAQREEEAIINKDYDTARILCNHVYNTNLPDLPETEGGWMNENTQLYTKISEMIGIINSNTSIRHVIYSSLERRGGVDLIATALQIRNYTIGKIDSETEDEKIQSIIDCYNSGTTSIIVTSVPLPYDLRETGILHIVEPITNVEIYNSLVETIWKIDLISPVSSLNIVNYVSLAPGIITYDQAAYNDIQKALTSREHMFKSLSQAHKVIIDKYGKLYIS